MGYNCWTYSNPVKIKSGVGSVAFLSDMLPKEINILLVTTAGFTKRGGVQRIKRQCGKSHVVVYDQVTPNPELDELEDRITLYKKESIDVIVALGGGSVLDTAKVLSVALNDSLIKPLNSVFREDMHHDWGDKIPLVAIPTTSGTGAEVTPFATIWDSVNHKKYSLAGDAVYPSIALLDPVLTLSLPKEETMYTALDAISHSLESLWNKNKTSISELYARESLSLSVKSLPLVLEEHDNIEHRSNLQNASLFAGLAISQTRTAIAHSISYPLTSHFNVPHGLACSFTLPEIIKHYINYSKDEVMNKIMTDVSKLLMSLDLPTKVRKYVSVNDVDNVYKEMYSPERANNYILNISLDEIKEITLDAMQLNE